MKSFLTSFLTRLCRRSALKLIGAAPSESDHILYIVIQKVLNEYKLPGMLEKYLGQDYGLFLDLVSFMIVDEENVGLHYPDFAFCHPLFSENMKIYGDVKVSRMLNSISKDQIIGFLNDWNKGRDHK